MSELQKILLSAINIVGEHNEIQKRPMKYAQHDEIEWKEVKLPQLERLLDEAYNLAEPDYPNTQLALNHELEQDIERRVSA